MSFPLLAESYGYRGVRVGPKSVSAFVFPAEGGADVSVHVDSATARSRTPLAEADILPFIRAHLTLLGVGDVEFDWQPSDAPLSKKRTVGVHEVRQIYYLQDEDGFIKIGVAKDAKKRLSTLQTGIRQRLTLLATHPGTVLDEKALHRKFHHLRTRGEWFDPAAELINHIEGIQS